MWHRYLRGAYVVCCVDFGLWKALFHFVCISKNGVRNERCTHEKCSDSTCNDCNVTSTRLAHSEALRSTLIVFARKHTRQGHCNDEDDLGCDAKAKSWQERKKHTQKPLDNLPDKTQVAGLPQERALGKHMLCTPSQRGTVLRAPMANFGQESLTARICSRIGASGRTSISNTAFAISNTHRPHLIAHSEKIQDARAQKL